MESLSLDKIGVRQIDQADCGVACVLTILNYFGVKESREVIGSLVGVTSTGSTLLGLKEALVNYGIKSEGYEASIKHIKELKFPCILHTVLENKFLHYIVLFKYENERFTIFDPAKGVIFITESELVAVWKSNRLLLVESQPSIDQPTTPAAQPEVNVYKSLILLFRKHQNFLITAGLLGIIISILGLSLAIFTQSLLDTLLSNGDMHGIKAALILVFGILIVKSLLLYGRNYLLIVQSRSFNSETIKTFFGKIMFLPLPFFESKSTGDLITRMHDTIKIQSVITTFFGQTVIDYFVLISITIFLLTQSFTIGILVLLTVILFIFLSLSYKQKILQAQRNTMHSYALSESVFIDSITGIETIKSCSKEELFTTMIKNVYNGFQNNFFKFNHFKIRISLLLDVCATTLVVIIFWLGINQYLNKAITLGELVAVLQLSLFIQPSLLQIFISNTQIQEAVTAFSRVQEYTSLKPENVARNEDSLITIDKLEVRNLSFKYPGRSLLIDDLSLTVNKGEILILKGRSGSGKTTLFKVLQKFYSPTLGNIILNESINISGINTKALRDRIGYVSQNIKIFNASLLFNISLDEETDPEKIILFCNEIGLHDEFMKFPDTYNSFIGETGVKLSGGQKQLVGFARALYKKPDVLLLDEAIVSMDMDLQRSVQKSLQKISQSLIIISSSHGSEWDHMNVERITLP